MSLPKNHKSKKDGLVSDQVFIDESAQPRTEFIEQGLIKGGGAFDWLRQVEPVRFGDIMQSPAPGEADIVTSKGGKIDLKMTGFLQTASEIFDASPRNGLDPMTRRPTTEVAEFEQRMGRNKRPEFDVNGTRLRNDREQIVARVYDTPELLHCAEYPVGRNMVKNKVIVKRMIELFRALSFPKENVAFNFICTGSSGAIIATMFCMEFDNSQIIHIKKPGENSHDRSGAEVRHTWDESKFTVLNVVVDDHISSGATMRKIADRFFYREAEAVIDFVVVGGRVSRNQVQDIFRGQVRNIICGR